MKKLLFILITLLATINFVVAQDSEPDYLFFEVEAGTTITFGAPSKLEYSLDKITWQILTSEGVTASNDCNIYFRGNNPDGLNTSSAYSDYSSFSLTKPAKCSGNIMTLIDQCGLTKKIPCSYCFYKLFYNCKITTAPLLPANQLRPNCYQNMFDGCSYLIEPPDLPANNYVFIAEYCYASMFANCTNLKRIPVLPTERVVSHAYSNMFQNCTSLEKVTLCFTSSAYDNNTYGANVGTTFDGMFSGCSNLKYISVRFKEWYVSRSYYAAGRESRTPVNEAWVKDVCSKGIFVCPSALQKKYGDDYIPTGWTVRTLESLYSISISPSSQPYISISETEELVAGTTISFTIADQPSNCNPAIVTVQGTNTIETTHSGNDYYFTMPRENVTITVTYPPINYTITTDDYSLADKTEASEGETVNVTFKDRAGYNLTSATYNGTDLTITNGTAQFTMPAANVTIATNHTPIEYNITADQYSTPNKTTANVGDEITVSFANIDGYTLTSATYNGTALTITNNAASFTMPAANVTIATTYTKVDYTITADQYSTPNKATANVGDEISVTFANREGYNLTSATYNGTALNVSNNTATFTMPAANVTITTTYTKIDYTITADQYSTPNKTTANVGDEITVTFTNRDGYNLTSATYNGTALNISNNTASFTMPAANVSIATTYTKVDYTITADQYSTPNKTTANVGDEITVTFANRDGYNLTSATYNGTALNINNNNASFTMPAENVTIATTYTKIDYTITADQYSTPSKPKANVGDEITVTFAKRDGYNLTSATYNGTALNFSNNTATFTMPAANVTIATTYTKIDYTITADQYSTPNKTTANIGDEITVTFANRDGYNLTSATYNGTSLNISNNTASFTMPAANVTIASTYTKIDYTITADQYSTPNKTKANVGDEITVSFANRDGYNLTSATYNGTALTITNNKASFTMPAANVSIATTYTPIEYNVTAGEYVTANKSKATINDQVSFTVADRTADGYQLNKVLINNTEFSGTSFNMADYLTDVTITAVYSKIGYTITSDAYSTPSKTKANVGDEITVTFSKRDGYNLTSATYNGTALTIVDYKSQFTMPDEDVEIKTVYTLEQQQITKPEIITDNNVEITLPENLTENTEVTFTVQQKPGFTAFVYVNGVLTNEYKFVFTGKVEIKVDYKELTVSNISAETESYCAGDEINLTFATNPYAVEYELTFSNEAQKEGFENIDFHPVASYEKQPTSFKIPQSAKPGKYHAFIRVKDSKDSHSKQYAFDFEVLYPTDIIETKYSDLICVNNSKNEYIGYQWFKNNKEIKGADKQFYIDAPMLNGSYSVALILKNGEKIRTCNYVVNNPALKKSLKPSVNVYPNPAKASAPIVVELSEMDDLTDAYILIYNQLGVQIDKITNLSPHNTLSLKKGFYHGVVICGSTKLTFKIIVNE